MPSTDPVILKESKRKYYEKNRDRVIAKSKKWVEDNRKRHYARCKKWRDRNKEKLVAHRREKHQELKHIVLSHYSSMMIPICNHPYCMITDENMLSIDHVNNNGSAHRKEIKLGAGGSFYKWLVRNDFPSGFQVLCFNHNFAKQISGSWR